MVLNRLICDYDQLVICGPVFPHEVVGFSGGAKYFFPGIAGAEIVNFTHWLGALVTSMRHHRRQGYAGAAGHSPRRRVRAQADTAASPWCSRGRRCAGCMSGRTLEAWSAAADLSAQLNIMHVPGTFRRVLSMPPPMYDDLWTAAKAMYKTEPVVADGGEVIIYAPHITEVSYTHGKLIDEVGYHVRDYFLKQWDRFKDVPGGILAHSTHVKGQGTYDASPASRPRASR